ncbi:MAG: hypothetical protein KDN19_13040 [Verrucomicrobiae bacterium]|nr:hypothetical protein [Verrucomicrobiae bacterium]
MKLIPDLRAIIALAAVLLAPMCLSQTDAAKDKPAAKPSTKPAVAAAAPSKPRAEAASKTTKPGNEAATAANSGEEKKKEPGEKEKADSKEEKPEAPKLHSVKRGEFELKVELDGTFVASQATPVSVVPEAWSDLTIVEVLPHGTPVKKGDVLARFETKNLEKEIAELHESEPLKELNDVMARRELETLEKTTPLSLENARRAKMEAEQDFAYFQDVSRKLRERDAHEDVSRIEQQLSYAREELNQLEKMYKADDLTEETEEIILTRARNDVAYYEWILEQTKARSERTLSTSLPREEGAQRRGVESRSLAWRDAERNLPDALKKKRLEISASERARDKEHERLANLEHDLGLLTVKAPHDGIVYYGSSNRGKWVTAATVERKLVPGGKIAPHEVFLTLVKPSPLEIQVAVPESKLRHLANGQKGFAWPSFDADAEFKTQLKSVSFVPYADNTYDATFSIPKLEENAPPLFPGMTAKVRLDLYSTTEALTVPKSGVHKDGEGYYVHLKDGAKRRVKVGKSNEKSFEILSGLKEGDEVKIP